MLGKSYINVLLRNDSRIMNELSTVDTLIEQNQNIQVSIGLVNPKTPVNVAGIMRASGCYQVKQVLYTGKRYEYAAMHETQYEVDKQQASKTIPLIGVDDLLAQVDEDTQIVCVDLVEGAIPLPNFVHPDKAIYIFSQKMARSHKLLLIKPIALCMCQRWVA